MDSKIRFEDEGKTQGTGETFGVQSFGKVNVFVRLQWKGRRIYEPEMQKATEGTNERR